jgi:hypothetical protein
MSHFPFDSHTKLVEAPTTMKAIEVFLKAHAEARDATEALEEARTELVAALPVKTIIEKLGGRQQACVLLGVEYSALGKWIERGKIPDDYLVKALNIILTLEASK